MALRSEGVLRRQVSGSDNCAGGFCGDARCEGFSTALAGPPSGHIIFLCGQELRDIYGELVHILTFLLLVIWFARESV